MIFTKQVNPVKEIKGKMGMEKSWLRAKAMSDPEAANE